ncbi:phosphoribosylglycinamide formyltransferase [Thermodesulfobacteriota bacterium]
MNLGFFASHDGSNMQAIIDACKSGVLQARPSVVISNNSNSGAIERAKNERIPYYHLSSKSHTSPETLDIAVLSILQLHRVDIVILAGYMKKLGQNTLSHYKNRVLNIHPALLPKFGGKGMYGQKVHEAVLEAGETKTGVSIHIVDEEYDTGPVIAQAKVSVMPGDTVTTLSKRVLEKEHMFFIETLQAILRGDIDLSVYL